MARAKKSEIEADNAVKTVSEGKAKAKKDFTIVVNVPLVNIRDIPSLESVVIKTALKGTKLKADGLVDGFYRLVGGGFVMSEYCKELANE